MTKIILVTGKAQSGKDTTVDFLRNNIDDLLVVSKKTENGQLDFASVNLCDGYCSPEYQRTKKYSFAKYLKDIAVELFDIAPEKVWGSNAEKDQLTHIRWADLKNVMGITAGQDWFEKVYGIAPEKEYLSGRQFLQFFGSEIVRKLYHNAWVSRCYKDIKADGVDYAFVCDTRFENEIDFFLEKGESPIVIHLKRNILKSNHISETALDNYDWGKLAHYYPIDNSDWSWEIKDAYLKEHILPIFTGVVTNG